MMQRTGSNLRKCSRANFLLTRLLLTLLAMTLSLGLPLAAYGGGNGEGAATPTPEDSLVLEDGGNAIRGQTPTLDGLGAVARPPAALTQTVYITGTNSAPTAVDLVVFGQGPDIAASWWWVSWPWLMALITAISLFGVLLVRRRWATQPR